MMGEKERVGRCKEHQSPATFFADGSTSCLYCCEVETSCHCTADPQLEADIELGTALNSDKAERVLAEIMRQTGTRLGGIEAYEDSARAILAALREGLAPGVLVDEWQPRPGERVVFEE